jgi:hypothetical protein
MTRKLSLPLAAAIISIQSAAAFVPATTTTTALRTPASAVNLNLVPEQSRQLVAYSQDYFAKKAKESASKASHLSSPRRTSSSSSSSSRQGVFTALVSRLVGKESRGNDIHSSHHADDEVSYPIVGHTLVEGRALPSAGQEAACKLHLMDKEEEPFGFWTSAQGGDALWS